MKQSAQIIEVKTESGYTDLSEVRRPRRKEEKKDRKDSK